MCHFEPVRPSSPMASHAEGMGLGRPSSIRSVASNSSVSSGTSLTRRARTRTRSRTVTGGAAAKAPDSAPELPHPGETRLLQDFSLTQPTTLGETSDHSRCNSANRVKMNTVPVDVHQSRREGDLTNHSPPTAAESMPSPGIVKVRT